MIDRELLAHAIWGTPPRGDDERWEEASDGAHAHFRRRAEAEASLYEKLNSVPRDGVYQTATPSFRRAPVVATGEYERLAGRVTRASWEFEQVFHETGLMDRVPVGHYDHCQGCRDACGTAAEGMTHK